MAININIMIKMAINLNYSPVRVRSIYKTKDKKQKSKIQKAATKIM